MAVCLTLGLLTGIIIEPAQAGAAPAQWTITPSPNQLNNGQVAYNLLSGVSCTKPDYCEAVGTSPDGTLVETWSGSSWSLVPSPEEGGLSSVSCTSSDFCVAVGAYPSESGSQTLILNNGEVITSPNPGSNDGLSSVSCTSSSFCVAVGSYLGEQTDTLIESWDGTTWSVDPSPTPGGNEAFLTSVSCVSSTSCMAVGYEENLASLTLAEVWNGTSWSITSTPNKGKGQQHDVLNGVSCVSSTDCTAAGNFAGKHGYAETLFETWDGQQWNITPSPTLPTNATNFYDPDTCGEANDPAPNCSVSCSKPASCVAVGSYVSNEKGESLIESWNGTKWSVTSSPSRYGDRIEGVSCFKQDECVAVGLYLNKKIKQWQTFIETGS